MSNEKGDTITYTAEDAAAGFAGAATFSPEAAGKVAKAITDAGPLGDLDPDEAGRRVQEAVYEATGEAHNGGTRNGLRVSVDTCLTAVSAMHARKAFQGFQVGRGDQGAGAARATSGSGDAGPQGGQGTAAAVGAGSQGAGAAAGAAPTSARTGRTLSGAAAKSAAAKSGKG